MHLCSSYELQSVAEKSSVTEKSVVEASPEYEVIPAFSEANNPTVLSNIAYGAVQLQQQQHKARMGAKMPAMQESGTQGYYEINKEEEPAYDVSYCP